jgi:hypothetical protein
MLNHSAKGYVFRGQDHHSTPVKIFPYLSPLPTRFDILIVESKKTAPHSGAFLFCSLTLLSGFPNCKPKLPYLATGNSNVFYIFGSNCFVSMDLAGNFLYLFENRDSQKQGEGYLYTAW